MKRVFFLLVIVLLFLACTKLDYIGEEYPPTTNIDQYYSEDDIEREYKVMGRIVATAGELVSAEKMQKKIIEKAMEKGADAVLILGLDVYSVSGSSMFSEKTETEEKKGKTITKTTGSTSSSSEDEKQVEAIFLKYH